MPESKHIKGIIFDKDGTLLDFDKTYGPMIKEALLFYSHNDCELAIKLGDQIGYNFKDQSFVPNSLIVSHSIEASAIAIGDVLGQSENKGFFEEDINERAKNTTVVPVDERLAQTFDDLKLKGYSLGVVTNDAIEPTLIHLEKLGIKGHLDFIAGYDSGFGQKPDARLLEAFKNTTGITKENVAIVGDSRKDLDLSKLNDAGLAVGVLSGHMSENELQEAGADLVLNNVCELPEILEKLQSR